jgi:hypothetical protein
MPGTDAAGPFGGFSFIKVLQRQRTLRPPLNLFGYKHKQTSGPNQLLVVVVDNRTRWSIPGRRPLGRKVNQEVAVPPLTFTSSLSFIARKMSLNLVHRRKLISLEGTPDACMRPLSILSCLASRK